MRIILLVFFMGVFLSGCGTTNDNKKPNINTQQEADKRTAENTVKKDKGKKKVAKKEDEMRIEEKEVASKNIAVPSSKGNSPPHHDILLCNNTEAAVGIYYYNG